MVERFPDTIFHPVQWGRPRLPEVPTDFHIIGNLHNLSNREQLQLLLTPFDEYHLPQDARMKAVREHCEELISQALDFCKMGHEGQKRALGGVPYYTHPLQAAIWMSQHGARWQGITATLLHDVPEDWKKKVSSRAELPLQLILDRFGEEVMYEVYRLSNYKYRNERMQHPWNLEYYSDPTPGDEYLKENFKDQLIEKKKGTLFRDGYEYDSEPHPIKEILERIHRATGILPQYLNPLDWEAIDGKGCDSVHNYKTLGVYDQQTLEKRLKKFHLLALSRVLPAIDPKYSKYFPGTRFDSPYPFMVPVPSRRRLNLEGLSRLPHPGDPIINLHSEGPEHDALIPHSGFGYGEAIHRRLGHELSQRVHDLGGSVEDDRSVLSLGHQQFEAFKIHQGDMTFNDLTRIMRHIYLKFAKNPFESNAADFEVNGLHCAFDNEDRDTITAYVPMTQFPLVTGTYVPDVQQQLHSVDAFLQKARKPAGYSIPRVRMKVPYAGSPHLMFQIRIPVHLRGDSGEAHLKQQLGMVADILKKYPTPQSRF